MICWKHIWARENWITLAIKFPNNYFIYDHERQEKLFAWYIRDFKVKNNRIKWVVHKNWRIDFNNNIEIEKYQEINYIRWNIPYKVYQNYKPKLTILENLKINWEESDYEKYDTTYWWFKYIDRYKSLKIGLVYPCHSCVNYKCQLISRKALLT